MNIAVTSPSFSKSNVLRAEILKYFDRVKFNDKDSIHSEEDLIQFIDGCEGVVIGLHQITQNVLTRSKYLKMIAKYGVGLDNIPADLCEQHSVQVGWTGGVNRQSVAEQTLSLIIALTRNLYVGSNLLKQGQWVKDGGRQLSELTVGVVGFGFVGQLLSQYLKPFGCRILVNDIINCDEQAEKSGVICTSFETLIEQSDVVSLHVNLNSMSNRFINKAVFEKMKKTAYLINTSRGQIVDQAALKYALLNGNIAGAALDVYEEEPPKDREFLSLPNLICTPHIAGNAQAAVEAMGMSAINHLKRLIGS
tara:strand:+ start:281 stop:1201 length:921 start_codon:yes stop_codon:yes gene_type:complete